MVSSEGQMETGVRYPIPTEETPYTWMSYGKLSSKSRSNAYISNAHEAVFLGKISEYSLVKH